MNGKPFILLLLVLCFAISFSSLCVGEENKTALTVKEIVFTSDKGGGERIALLCNRSCLPEFFSLEEGNPRVVMDMKGVFLIQTKIRNFDTGGRLVKRVRSYLDKQTKILRIVLDMEPSKNSIIRPMQDPSGNAYVLTIYEGPGVSEVAKGSLPSQEKRIKILPPDSRLIERGKLQEAAPSPEKHVDVKAVKDVQPVGQDKVSGARIADTKDAPSVGKGRSQLDAGEFAAAVDTFTKIISDHPQDSLSYRLRGNAYDNLGDRQKAVADWTQAARLGDSILQSYLDFLHIKWRENPAK